MDPATLQRRMNAQARALVYIDTSVAPRDSIQLTWNKGEHLVQKVTYEDRRDFCTLCDQTGHLATKCSKIESPPENRKGTNGAAAVSTQENERASPDCAQELAGFRPRSGPSRETLMPIPTPQPSCNNSAEPITASEDVFSASSSPLPFGTLESPKTMGDQFMGTEDQLDFVAGDFSEVHKQMDVIHGDSLDEENLIRTKKNKTSKKKSTAAATGNSADTDVVQTEADDTDALDMNRLEDKRGKKKKKNKAQAAKTKSGKPEIDTDYGRTDADSEYDDTLLPHSKCDVADCAKSQQADRKEKGKNKKLLAARSGTRTDAENDLGQTAAEVVSDTGSLDRTQRRDIKDKTVREKKAKAAIGNSGKNDVVADHDQTESDSENESGEVATCTDFTDCEEPLDTHALIKKKRQKEEKEKSHRCLSGGVREGAQSAPKSKKNKEKKAKHVRVFFESPSDSHPIPVLPGTNMEAGGGGRRVPTFGGK